MGKGETMKHIISLNRGMTDEVVSLQQDTSDEI